jgi:hypothetical protein
MGEMQEGEARAGQSYTDTPARVAFRRFALATVITYVRTASTTFFACPLCRKFACTWWASSHSNALILWDCYPHTSAPGRSSTMKSHSRHVLPAALAVLAFLAIASVAAGIGIALPAYRADLSAARERATMSQIAQTPCGPIEYSSVGQGDPVLVVHGAGGGFDQGQYFAAPLAAHGFRVIAMSRCGYLRTPASSMRFRSVKPQSSVPRRVRLRRYNSPCARLSAWRPSSCLSLLPTCHDRRTRPRCELP